MATVDPKSVGQRIRAYRDAKGISREDIAKAMNTTVANYGNIERGEQLPTLHQLQGLVSYSDISYSYWMEGQAEVKLSDIEIAYTKNKKSQAIPVSFTDRQVIQVPFVNNYARAGYLTGYSNETYIEGLPKLPWLVDKEYKGTYMCFEVNGDSMDDGTRDSYMEGDILLCREIATHLWVSSKLHIRKWDFVIAHKTEGIIVKRIVEHNVDKGTIVVHSLNDLYPDYTIELKDVVKIFNVVKVSRSK